MLDDDGPLVEREQIRTLLTIVERKSFSAAAAALGVRQPAVSQQVRRLEQRLGRPVFRRTARGVELTADGEAIMIYARAMVALTEDLRRHFSLKVPQVIRIGLAEDFSRTALPHVLWLFAREHPAIELRISCMGFDQTMAAYRDRRLDACVLVADPRIPEAEPLWNAPLAWFGRDDLPLPIADPVPLIVPPADVGAPGPGFLRHVAIDALSASRRTWRVAVETFSLATAESALHAGLGVVPLPRGLRLMPRIAELGDGHQLPALPDRQFVMMCRDDAEAAALSFCGLLRTAAQLSFALSDGTNATRAAAAEK